MTIGVPPTTAVSSESPATGRRPWPQTAAVAGVLLLGAFFVAVNRAEVPAAGRALRDANLLLVAGAAALSALFMVNLAALYLAAYRAVGLHVPFRAMLRVSAGAAFLNMISKSGGMGGLALFLRDAGRRGQPRSRVVSAYILAALLGHAAFTLTLATALVVVRLDGRLTRAEVVASSVFTVYVAAQAVVFVAAVRSRRALRMLHALPARIGRRLARLAGRHPPPAEPDHEAADDLYEAMGLLLSRPRRMLIPGFHALMVEAIGVATIWMVLASFGEQVHPQVPLVAYSVSVLFSIVGVLPAGVGFAEASLGAVFVSFGIPGPTAAVAVMTYRVFEVWLPFVIGAWAAQSVARRKGEP